MKHVFDTEGEIRDVDPLAGLVACWRDRAGGTLRFTRGAAECGFDLDDGEVVAVLSSDPRFETAAILVRAGKISADAIEKLAPQGGDPALAALQTGLLTRREWKWGEKIRGIEVLSDLLTWNDGQYRFDAGAPVQPGDFRVPVPRLLLELFLRSRDRSLIDHQLGPSDQTLVRGELFEAEFPAFGLTADAEQVVRLIDGKSTASEIAEKSSADEFAVRKLLAALVTLGLVHPVPSVPARVPEWPPARETEPAEPFPPAGADSAVEGEEPASDGGAEPFPSDAPAVEAFEREETEPPSADLPPAEETEMIELPTAGGGSPLDRFEPTTAPSPWEAEPPRSDSGDLWGATPASPAPAEPPAPDTPSRGGRGLIAFLVILLAAVAAVLLLRSRSGSSTSVAALHATSVPVTFPPPVTAAPVGSAARPAATAVPAPTTVPTAAMTLVPTPRRAAPTAIPTRPRSASPAPAAAAPASGPASPSASGETKGSWASRAAHDRQRLDADRKTRYSIQLELVCETASLEEAWRHDHAQSLWLLPVNHSGRDCYRVFWGRFPSLDAARKAKSGVPSYFVTTHNHPAVVSVR